MIEFDLQTHLAKRFAGCALALWGLIIGGVIGSLFFGSAWQGAVIGLAISFVPGLFLIPLRSNFFFEDPDADCDGASDEEKS
jgi:hypothetical protein